MFAVIKTGGKQYKVAEGDLVQVEKLAGDVGTSLSLTDVLMVNKAGKMLVGSPFVKNAKVELEIVAQERGAKIIVFKKKRRQNYRRKNNHRQDYTIVKIKAIAA
jgi:large subunit ribosomal protein L21